MNSLNAERLYAMLPALYRIRDEQQGYPLRDLVALIAREFEALEENVEQLYDDQFIETCAAWVAPYIGDLIGYRPLHGVVPAVASPRAEVANTIGHRRRKGTAAMLEQLAHDVTGWPARAVEFFEQLATTQYMNHVRLHAPATAALRSTPQLLQLGGPFNTVAHTAEMRRPEAGSGRYNIPNIGIFLWRLEPFRLSDVPLTPALGDASGRKFRFNPLGADQPLFRAHVPEETVTHIAQPANVPDPINLRLMARALTAASADPALPNDYGSSIVLSRPNPDRALTPIPVPAAEICVCNLRNVADRWAHEASIAANKIAIDPQLGRVLLGTGVAGPLLATFHSGFSRAIGGGEYARSVPDEAEGAQRAVRAGAALQPHLDDIAGGGRLVVADSVRYAETPVFKVNGVTDPGAPGIEVVVMAHDGARPLIAAAGPVMLAIGARGRLVLDGLVISGGALQLVATDAADHEPRELVLRHCTLVPGLALQPDGSATAPGAPSLIVGHPFASIKLEQCIVGALRIAADARIELTDCIVDAGAPDAVAFRGDNPGEAGAMMMVTDSTLIGQVHVRLMRLAKNTLFFARRRRFEAHAPLRVERRQEGCIRFCFVPPDALAAPRFRCVPSAAQPDMLPHFTSLRYADPGYAQLRTSTPKAIREGAEDGLEIGVMRRLFQPQREASLRIRLDEYLRFGLHAGLFYVT